ncbi:hypothetical protein BJ742DRAFT_555656 [Cladochytrium replicatum]|nr:hypothetical protein BJ742DRAFT_555656 [Cladochytrium replicatum]
MALRLVPSTSLFGSAWIVGYNWPYLYRRGPKDAIEAVVADDGGALVVVPIVVAGGSKLSLRPLVFPLLGAVAFTGWYQYIHVAYLPQRLPPPLPAIEAASAPIVVEPPSIFLPSSKTGRVYAVIGAETLLGSYIVKALADRGEAVVAIVAKSTFKRSTLWLYEDDKGVKVVEVDFTKNVEDGLKKALVGVTTIFYAAETVDHVSLTRVLLSVILKTPSVCHLIYTSSFMVLLGKDMQNFYNLSEDTPYPAHPLTTACHNRATAEREALGWNGFQVNDEGRIRTIYVSAARAPRVIIGYDGEIVIGGDASGTFDISDDLAVDYIYIEDLVQGQLLLEQQLARHPQKIGGRAYHFAGAAPTTKAQCLKLMKLLKIRRAQTTVYRIVYFTLASFSELLRITAISRNAPALSYYVENSVGVTLSTRRAITDLGYTVTRTVETAFQDACSVRQQHAVFVSEKQSITASSSMAATSSTSVTNSVDASKTSTTTTVKKTTTTTVVPVETTGSTSEEEIIEEVQPDGRIIRKIIKRKKIVKEVRKVDGKVVGESIVSSEDLPDVVQTVKSP